MRSAQSLSITLPLEMSEMVKAKVASGEYAAESEVIRDRLRALAARDAAVEKRLLKEVTPTIEGIDRGAIGTMPAEEVRRRPHALIDALTSGKTPSQR